MTAMALAIIVMMATLGVVYLALWAGAADDLTRLLPASTRAYAAAPSPWAAMTRTLAMPIWQDRAELQAQVLRDGYLAGERTGEIAGVPLESVREIMRGMDSVEMALVPTAEGDSLLVFVELRDTTQRKRAFARLAPLLETIDRRVGFRVDKIRRRPWQGLVGADIEPPRVVDMEPWIILSWGSPIGLEELLDARVEGRGDALYRRDGFALKSSNGGNLRLAIDASSAWRLFATAAEPPPGGLVEYLDLLTVEARAEDASDILTLRAEITDRDLARTLTTGLRKAEHKLAAIAPAEALFVISATGDDLSALVEVMRGLVFRLQRDFAPSAGTGALTTNLIAAAADLPPGGGEIALVGMPFETPEAFMSPLVLVRATTPDALAERLATSMPSRFGDGFAHGEVMHQGTLLHLEIPHPIEPAPTAAPTPEADADPDIRLAWRVRNGILEIAPTVAILDRFAASPRALGETPRLAAARRGLPREAAVMWIADRRVLTRPGAPLLALLGERLRPDFNFGMTLDAIGDHLALRSNLGLWTLATAVASGSRKEIDTFALPGLEPRCREAYDAFCTLYPNAVPCRPFALGRLTRIEAVCGALFDRR